MRTYLTVEIATDKYNFMHIYDKQLWQSFYEFMKIFCSIFNEFLLIN